MYESWSQSALFNLLFLLRCQFWFLECWTKICPVKLCMQISSCILLVTIKCKQITLAIFCCFCFVVSVLFPSFYFYFFLFFFFAVLSYSHVSFSFSLPIHSLPQPLQLTTFSSCIKNAIVHSIFTFIFPIFSMDKTEDFFPRVVSLHKCNLRFCIQSDVYDTIC